MPRTGIPKLTEKEFLAQVTKLARLMGWKTYHTWKSIHSDSGFPDLVCVRVGKMLVAELKVGKNLPTPAQLDWLEAFAKAGVSAYIWTPDSWPDIERILTRP